MKVGDYIRTSDGYIFKITKLFERGKYNDSNGKIIQRIGINGLYQRNDNYLEANYIYSDWIINSNEDVKKLIVAGDYVNGEEVTPLMIKTRDEQGVFGVPDSYNAFIEEIKIKDIVTKERFEGCKYVI